MKLLERPAVNILFENAIDRSQIHTNITLLSATQLSDIRQAFVSQTGIHAPDELAQFKHNVLLFTADSGLLVNQTEERNTRTVFSNARLTKAWNLNLLDNGDLEVSNVFGSKERRDDPDAFVYDKLAVRSLRFDAQTNLSTPLTFAVTPFVTLADREGNKETDQTFLFLKRLKPITMNRYLEVSFTQLIAELVHGQPAIDVAQRRCAEVFREINQALVKGISQARSNLLRHHHIFESDYTISFNLILTRHSVRKVFSAELNALSLAIQQLDHVESVVEALSSFQTKAMSDRRFDWFDTAIRDPSEILRHAI